MPKTIVITGTATGMGRATVGKFAKIDKGDSIPDAYQAGIARFFAGNSSTGSDLAVTADVIYRAVIDPDPAAVRYYSAPDSLAFPAASGSSARTVTGRNSAARSSAIPVTRGKR